MQERRSILLFLLALALVLLIALILAPRREPPAVPAPTAAPTDQDLPLATLTPFRPLQTQTPSASGALPSARTPASIEEPREALQPTATPETGGRSFFVAPVEQGGSPGGDGSKEHPWELRETLKGEKPLKPGDTVWLLGGLYNYRDEEYLYVRVKGKPEQPVTFRAYPGERVTLDAALVVRGEWTTFWGLEVIDSNLDRTEAYFRNDGIAAWKPGIKLINNIVHDAGGFGFWWQAEDSEMYGNLVYNNGFIGSDRGHGHGVYTTNKKGIKRVEDNIVFNNFSGINFHAYSEKTYLDGFLFQGNVSFNGRFLVGGLVPASDVTLKDNFFFRGPVVLGYKQGISNHGLSLVGNQFHAAEGSYLTIQEWSEVHAAKNVAWQNAWQAFFIQQPFNEPAAYSSQQPSGTQVTVRPNRYEPGRGHVIIYNWDRTSHVNVDLAALGYKKGDRYILHNAQNYFDEVIEGTYDGKLVRVPMHGWTVADPTGWDKPVKPSTFPEFGVFIVERVPSHLP